MANRKQKASVSRIAAVGLIALLVIGAVVGTVAYFTDTASVTNTFTVGEVGISLSETKPAAQTAKMIPGTTIDKDPKVTVKGKSLDCWLFVQIDKSDNWSTFMADYELAEGWTQGDDSAIPANVYYREVSSSDEDSSFGILKDDKVRVLDTVTQADLDALEESTYPSLGFTAYACQKPGVDAAQAWAELSTTD